MKDSLNETLSQIFINSGCQPDLSKLTENTDQYDISQKDFLRSLIKENYNISLSYSICEKIDLKQPYAAVYISKQKDDSNNFEVIKKDIQTKTNTLQTGFTQEVFQDMQAMYNTSVRLSAGKVLAGITAKEENKNLFHLLAQESTIKSPLEIPDSEHLENILYRLSKKVSESVLEMNQGSYKTLDSFCILDRYWASAILGSFSYMIQGVEKSLFLGRIGRTDYYLNPFPNTSSEFDDSFDYSFEIEDTSIPNYCYVGLNSKASLTSSLIFAPYLYESQYFLDPDTGENKLFIRNRYGLITNPLHEPLKNKSLLHKFIIKAI